MMLAGGIPIYQSPHVVDREKWIQVKFPRSKKKRIRKKWFWRSENWGHPPLDRAIVLDGAFYCHPDFYQQLQAALNRAREECVVPSGDASERER